MGAWSVYWEQDSGNFHTMDSSLRPSKPQCRHSYAPPLVLVYHGIFIYNWVIRAQMGFPNISNNQQPKTTTPSPWIGRDSAVNLSSDHIVEIIILIECVKPDTEPILRA